MTDPRYPIGRFTPEPKPVPETRTRHIEQISTTPSRMRRAVAGLTKGSSQPPIGTVAGLSGRSSITCRIAI
jgi:folylpolyglutamate synthase/dihydropteroate synthase